MPKEKRFSVVADPEFHKEVKLKTVQEGRVISEVIRGLLTKWLRGEVTLNNDANDEEGQPSG